MVQFRPEMEPLVRLIESTPREQCAAMAVEHMRRGVSYRQLMAALFLAGIRNVNPRPPGFALHCVFIIHSAHLLSLEAPPDSRLLPLFYALDNFKAAQERDSRQAGGDYTMRALSGAVPPGDRAAAELEAAMEAWDLERAERAAAGLARHRSASEAFGALWRYGARDYRNIGHKAIYVANAARTLEVIGWQHAEPVLRSLVLALLDFGREQKVNGYALDDQVFPANAGRVKALSAKLPASWLAAGSDPAVVKSLLETVRTAEPHDACAETARLIASGKAGAASVWDAVHLASAELAMRARGNATIVGIHSVTAANGLRHAYSAVGDPAAKLLLTLQGIGWMGQFRKWAETRSDAPRAFTITQLQPAEETAPDKAIAQALAGVPARVDEAAAHVMRLAADPAGRSAFLASALRSTISKGDEVHYYKYLAALVEDTAWVSPEWQPRFLAASVYYLKGSADAEPPAIQRAREALRNLPA
jgi:hypothetical protein